MVWGEVRPRPEPVQALCYTEPDFFEGGKQMSDSSFKVYMIGVHASSDQRDARREVEKVGAELEFLPFLTRESEIVEQTRDADGLIVVSAPITRGVLSSLERCKVIVRTGVGVDNIDIPAATEMGVAIVNVPDLWPREVANHAMMLLLAGNRRLRYLDGEIRADRWDPRIPPPVGALHGETLGIVGLGQIGRYMARRAAAFEMDLIAADPYIPDSVFEEYGVTPVTLDDLLRRSDYVSVHTPLTDETHHLINEDNLKLMKPTAYLINTSRGPVVQELGLLRALQDGWIGGAGIDVLETEPPSAGNPLFKLDNVLLTPHSGFYSDASSAQLPGRCGAEVARVLTGRTPLNLVNPSVRERLDLRDE